MTCPTCRAPWRETSECQRCGSDLAPLMRVCAAAAALAAGQWSDALRHAREAKQLQRTEAGDDLLLLARLLAR